MLSWVTYKLLSNRKNNAEREKIKMFKGTNTDMENKIEKLQNESTKFTDNFGVAKSLNVYFSTIGLKLNKQASMSSLVK